MAWWISGIKNDKELVGALREEADKIPLASVSALITLAANRLNRLADPDDWIDYADTPEQ